MQIFSSSLINRSQQQHWVALLHAMVDEDYLVFVVELVEGDNVDNHGRSKSRNIKRSCHGHVIVP
jgi:hypothetical protein